MKKTIHLVRHAQGFHNVEWTFNPVTRFIRRMIRKLFKIGTAPEDYFDPHLTPAGLEQVKQLRESIQRASLGDKIELLVVSPMSRTLETATKVFGGIVKRDFVAVELCREELGLEECNHRRKISEYRVEFPGVDFSNVVDDEDSRWEELQGFRESNEAMLERSRAFLRWLVDREESEIGVVSHGLFMRKIMREFGKNPKEEMLQNCELRSFILTETGDKGFSIESA